MQKILIADDHPLFREAIREVVAQLFAERGGEFSCLEASNTKELFALVGHDDEFDLILLDLFMPGASGLADLAALRERAPATPIIIISSLEDSTAVGRTLACGAAGYVAKSATKEVMVEALRTVLDGGVATVFAPRPLASGAVSDGALTPRQTAVLELLARGRSNKQIARDLEISDVTVKAHMTAILKKLGVVTRAQAIVAFQRDQLAGEHRHL